MRVQQRALIYLNPLEKKKKKVTVGQEPSGVFVVVLFILPSAQGPETESLDAVQVY